MFQSTDLSEWQGNGKQAPTFSGRRVKEGMVIGGVKRSIGERKNKSWTRDPSTYVVAHRTLGATDGNQSDCCDCVCNHIDRTVSTQERLMSRNSFAVDNIITTTFQ